MNISFIPKVCKGDDATFEGSLVLRLPSFDEKYKYIEESGFEPNADGKIESSLKNIKPLRKLVNFSVDHYVKVDIKKKSDSKEFKSFEEMSFDGDCDQILIEVAMSLMNGFKLGNA